MAVQINVCIRINPGFLDEQKRKGNKLIGHCSKLKDFETDNLFDSIKKEVFPAGFSRRIFIRNLSASSEKISFGIRPVRTEGDFCDRYLDENETLLFVGHYHVGICYIDSIQIVQETGRQDYETEQEIFVSPTPLPKDEGFINCVASLESLRQNTVKNLDEWQKYLCWRREIANKQIHGAKYFCFNFNKCSRGPYWLPPIPCAKNTWETGFICVGL